MKQLALKFHRDQRGQTMLFAVITMIFMVLVMAFPLNVGWAISKRVKLQNAADSAAYSAATVEADSLSAIAWLNNMQAYLYHKQYENQIKFCVFGVRALMEEWGTQMGPGSVSSAFTPDPEHDFWYQTFQARYGKTPKKMFEEFMSKDGKYINRRTLPSTSTAVPHEKPEDRTIEMWTLTLRQAAERIAKRIPQLMKYEAMRMAYVNTYDGTVKKKPENAVRMAFFPDNVTDKPTTPQLKFEPDPTGNDTTTSFLQFAKWSEGGKNPMVERAMQYAADLDATYIDKNTLKVDLPSGDNANEAWFNEYEGQPRRRDPGQVYTAYWFTSVCWHDKDKQGPGGHNSPKPCGHWHLNHLHVHYNCSHSPPLPPATETIHVPVPTTHVKGYEADKWCHNGLHISCITPVTTTHSALPGPLISITPLVFTDGKATLCTTPLTSPPSTPISATMGTSIHHVWCYCPMCCTKGRGEFDASAAWPTWHHLAYNGAGPGGIDPNISDHHFGLSKKSEIRCYLEDFCGEGNGQGDMYPKWLKFRSKDSFHKTFRSNYCPDMNGQANKIQGNLAPTIIMKKGTNNLFQWGITVALWQKQHPVVFNKPSPNGEGVYAEVSGMIAISSAKVGIRASPTDKAKKNFPDRLISGIGEVSRSGDPGGAGPYSENYMSQKFLDNTTNRKEPLSNGFHTNWGARLIPVRKSVPESEQGTNKAIKHVLAQTAHMYSWEEAADDIKDLGPSSGLMDSTALSNVSNLGEDDWAKLMEVIVH